VGPPLFQDDIHWYSAQYRPDESPWSRMMHPCLHESRGCSISFDAWTVRLPHDESHECSQRLWLHVRRGSVLVLDDRRKRAKAQVLHDCSLHVQDSRFSNHKYKSILYEDLTQPHRVLIMDLWRSARTLIRRTP